MSTYLHQHWVITASELQQFARERGWSEASIENAMASWDLFGDGMESHEHFERTQVKDVEDEDFKGIIADLFDLHPEVQEVLVVR